MKYVCSICGYIYDEEKEGVLFDKLPEDWKCPLCGAPKSEFKAAEERQSDSALKIKNESKTAKAYKSEPTDMPVRLSAGNLAALCSNLARGCEKQYKPEAAGLFNRLAEYFTGVVPVAEGETVDKLAAALQNDIDDYASLRATVDEAHDRGAARACVWGEKVTRILSSLVQRYLKEGEKFLADTEIWVCSVCGFVYIGETPPELCPVCKVPSWKFDKISGRAVK